MQLSIPSSRPEFSGFESYYAAEIAPYLSEKEKTRSEAVTNALMLGLSGAVIALVVKTLGPFGAASLQLGVMIVVGAIAAAAFVLRRARADITHGLLDLIAKKLGFSYRGAMERPDYYERFRRLKLLPAHNREEWEDEVSGAHAASGFVLCEAHLKYKSSGKNSSTRTVFHGQLFVIDYPKRFLGTTVVLRDMGALNALQKPGREFQRVGLASADFEKAFEAWSTDQVEARDLLDPLVLERFQELERLYGGKKLRAAFDEGKLLIAIETGDRLSIGTMFRPLPGAERVETILKEFDVVFDLIDVVLRKVVGRLDGAFSLGAVKKA